MGNNFRKMLIEGAENAPKKMELNKDYWEYFNLKIGGEAIIRILPDPVFSFVEHTRKIDGKIKKIRCTGGSNDVNGGRCLGCYYSNKDAQVKSVTTRKVYIMTVVDLRMIHSGKDAEGKEVIRECTGARCPICKQGHAPRIVGRKHWTLGNAHYGVINDVNLTVGSRCLNCKTGKISIESIVCKQCGEPIFTESQLAEMSEPVAMKELTKQFTCISCGHKDYPEETIQCSDCKEPERASIIDTNLRVKKIEAAGEGKYATLAIEPTYKWEILPEELYKLPPFKFQEVFPRLDLDIQGAILKMKNPWAGDKSLGVNEETAKTMFDPNKLVDEESGISFD